MLTEAFSFHVNLLEKQIFCSLVMFPVQVAASFNATVNHPLCWTNRSLCTRIYLEHMMVFTYFKKQTAEIAHQRNLENEWTSFTATT